MKLFRMFSVLALAALLCPSAQAAATWHTDVSQALTQSRAEKKHVLINFTGSDWCGWCMKLRKDVFLKPEFESYASTNLVLMEVDFPKHKTQPPALQQANQRLAAHFRVEAYPTLLVLNSEGVLIGKVSYANGGMRSFQAELEKILYPLPEPPPVLAAARATSTKRRAEKTSQVSVKQPASLTLSKITGSNRKRQAVINNQTLVAGQSATFKLANGPVKVSCLEVRERSVIVTFDGRKEKRELRLADGI